MRPPRGKIVAPPFPGSLEWINVATLRMDKQAGRPVLIEFWDPCRVSCLHTLPYVKAWHERYADAGLRVIAVHAPGYEPAKDPDVVRAAVERLGVEYAVALDLDFALWRIYANEGWPARYLWDQEQALFEVHFGEGGYEETERAIQELLGVEREPLAPVRPEDDPEALLVVPTAEVEGPYSGPYAAGGAWAVLSGAGTITVSGEERPVAFAGAHPLVEHGVHTEAVLDLELSDGVTCHAVSFTPGLAP